ncbi:nuclear transcription factor Y subunit A-4-like isoform X3 [Vitis riparia]|uniref:nuclear transcription factor Y subunit A-4-like isoform X3 n=1 Tax=Vitis riparia TaxID=96939 RepID=UPI00155A8B45|nr:nuclear transcription factor Y subunit A-4-like isoform X3 [Vitis riparia]
MAIRIGNLPKRSFDSSSVHSMPHFTVNCQAWWNSNEQQLPESFSKNLSLKVESPPQLYQNMKQLGLQLQDQDSSSSQSTGQSHQEVSAIGRTNSQDQCISSESVHGESCEKRVEGQSQMKPVFFMANPDVVFNPSQVDYGHSVTHVAYPYADPYHGGLVAAYGPHAVIQPQLVGIAPTRVPLPFDIAEDGPIFVNAKQYHGILRRRQSRAKMEAQNKLVKARKPYLHESRHLHALNRVRGSGGRFLSTKKLQEPDSTSNTGCHSVSGSGHFHQKGDTTEQPEHRFSGMSPHMGGAMQGGGGGTYGQWSPAPGCPVRSR